MTKIDMTAFVLTVRKTCGRKRLTRVGSCVWAIYVSSSNKAKYSSGCE